MRKTATAMCFAMAFALSAAVGAQQPGAGGGAARNDGVTTSADFEQSRSGSRDTLTLTGCLDRANNGTYELRKARLEPVGAGSAGSAGTTGTTGSATGTSDAKAAAPATAGGSDSTWILKSTTDLAPHVGHQVQVTGRLSSMSGSSESDTATTSPPTNTATGARMKDTGEASRSVDIQSIRMISQSCT